LPVSTTFPAPNWSNHTAGPAVSHMPGPGKRRTAVAEPRRQPGSLIDRLKHHCYLGYRAVTLAVTYCYRLRPGKRPICPGG
jgi:hypothetical protein